MCLRRRCIYNKTYFVSSATLIKVLGGTFNPKWTLILQFVGPQCGQTWVPGCMTLNFVWPLRQVLASGIRSMTLQVKGHFLQFFTFFCPLANNSNCFHSPVSFRFSDSSWKKPVSLKIARPSSLIFLHESVRSWKEFGYGRSFGDHQGLAVKRGTLYNDLWYFERNTLFFVPSS